MNALATDRRATTIIAAGLALVALIASLPADEQKRAAIFCQNYGEAGAIDLFGTD